MTYKSHRCFDLLTEFQKKAQRFLGATKPTPWKHTGEVIKSRLADGRFGGSEGVVPHCNLVGCGSLRWLESVSESRTSQKVVRHWKKRMNPFFARCSCYFLFMSFHLKNWEDDIEAREWSIATAIESLTSNIRAGAAWGATPVVWAWTDSSPSWSITYHSSFAGGCVMPLLPGCQRGWKVGPGRPHLFPSVRTVNWKFLPSSDCNCFG